MRGVGRERGIREKEYWFTFKYVHLHHKSKSVTCLLFLSAPIIQSVLSRMFISGWHYLFLVCACVYGIVTVGNYTRPCSFCRKLLSLFTKDTTSIDSVVPHSLLIP